MTLNGNGGNDREFSSERFSVGDGGNALERAWVRVRSRLRNEYGEAEPLDKDAYRVEDELDVLLQGNGMVDKNP